MKVGDLVKIQKTNGEFCKARVTSIDSSGATVMFYQNGFEVFKFIPSFRLRTNYSIMIFEFFRITFFTVILAAFLSGLFSNYQELKELNEACISSKNGYVSNIFGSQKCELHSVWKAFFKTFVDIWKFVADSFGTFINFFVSSLFANLGFFGYFELIGGITLILFFSVIFYFIFNSSK
ncbi:unnamed protein product [Brachionus calyciflorus]|uniref:Uncharacterized protein n=1 Tax=Brachionus calyciflorus TaxID=104777 RepID=A0A814KC23_9BILA|nr:unnamed protein product [Brachionus calyciflorus]